MSPREYRVICDVDDRLPDQLKADLLHSIRIAAVSWMNRVRPTLDVMNPEDMETLFHMEVMISTEHGAVAGEPPSRTRPRELLAVPAESGEAGR